MGNKSTELGEWLLWLALGLETGNDIAAGEDVTRVDGGEAGDNVEEGDCTLVGLNVYPNKEGAEEVLVLEGLGGIIIGDGDGFRITTPKEG